MLRNASAVHLVDEINIFGSRETSARKPGDFGPERIRKVGRLRPGTLCTAPRQHVSASSAAVEVQQPGGHHKAKFPVQ